MSKLFPLLFAGSLFTLALTLTFARTPQQATPPASASPQTPASPQAPASAQAPAPAEAPAKGPVAPDAKNPEKPTPESLAKAKSLYDIDCAMCHGENGSGESEVAKSMGLTLDNWTNPNTLANKPDGELFDTIRTGKGKMPPEAASRADNTAVWNLILYIRSLSKPQSPAPSSATK